MIDVESYRQNAADCLRQAEAEATPDDKNLLLNVALAWVRLAHQVQEVGIPAHSEHVIVPDAPATEPTADAAPAAANDDSESESDTPLVTH
jgi:hypothetical protein